FFQAEDGIRVFHVTGVQTCALPIYIFSFDGSQRKEGPLYKEWLEWRAKIIHDFIYTAKEELKQINPDIIFGDYTGSWFPLYFDRSEERRVGKDRSHTSDAL